MSTLPGVPGMWKIHGRMEALRCCGNGPEIAEKKKTKLTCYTRTNVGTFYWHFFKKNHCFSRNSGKISPVGIGNNGQTRSSRVVFDRWTKLFHQSRNVYRELVTDESRPSPFKCQLLFYRHYFACIINIVGH